jgi:hypothetical protein
MRNDCAKLVRGVVLDELLSGYCCSHRQNISEF